LKRENGLCCRQNKASNHHFIPIYISQDKKKKDGEQGDKFTAGRKKKGERIHIQFIFTIHIQRNKVKKERRSKKNKRTRSNFKR